MKDEEKAPEPRKSRSLPALGVAWDNLPLGLCIGVALGAGLSGR